MLDMAFGGLHSGVSTTYGGMLQGGVTKVGVCIFNDTSVDPDMRVFGQTESLMRSLLAVRTLSAAITDCAGMFHGFHGHIPP